MAKKVFELSHSTGDREWIAADTNVQALICYLNTTQCDYDTIEDATIEELPAEKWGEYIVTLTDELSATDQEMTFEEYMQKENNNTTELFCSSLI